MTMDVCLQKDWSFKQVEDYQPTTSKQKNILEGYKNW